MTTTTVIPKSYAGALSAIVAMLFFSVNDSTIKFLSDSYALHQIVFVRSAIGVVFGLLVIAPLTGGIAQLRTRRLHLHLIRGSFVVFANMMFFLGLAALPLAEAVAIFFISPLVIAAFSVIFLGEQVGPRRWAAIAVGLVGVLVIVQPGTAAFQAASLFPLAAAFGYASLHIMTRHLGRTESSASLSFYIQVTFVFAATLFGLALGHGAFAGGHGPSLEFLFRGWVWLSAADMPLLVLIGVTSALGGFFISYAYRASEAAIVAPFEYVAMPVAIVMGFLIFDELPALTDWIGIALIIGGGLFLLWREAVQDRRTRASATHYRR